MLKKLKYTLLFSLLTIAAFSQPKIEWQKTHQFDLPTMYHFFKWIWPSGAELDTAGLLFEDLLWDSGNSLQIMASIPLKVWKCLSSPDLEYQMNVKIPLLYSFNNMNTPPDTLYYADNMLKSDIFLFKEGPEYAYASTVRTWNHSEGNCDTFMLTGYSHFILDSLITDPYIYNVYTFGAHYQQPHVLRNALFKYGRMFSMNEVNLRFIGYSHHYKRLIISWPNDGYLKTHSYSRLDASFENKRGFWYYWGDTANFKAWAIEEEWPNCMNRLAWHNDTLSFIEIWGMDPEVNNISTNHCYLPTTLRKMSFSGNMILEKKLNVKLHYTDKRRVKSPYMHSNDHFFLIDNINTDYFMKGPYYNKFKLYKFDTNGNILLNKELKLPFDSCGRASWPIEDACGHLYFVFENYFKADTSIENEFTIYKVDGEGNFLWQQSLPQPYDWFGSKHMTLGNDNSLYMGSSMRDSMIFLQISNQKPDIDFTYLDTIVCKGDSIGFSVTDNINYNYQWHKNNQPIPGADSAIFIITSAEAADDAIYHCVVDNCRQYDTCMQIDLTVLNDLFQDSLGICQGDSFMFAGNTLKAPGDYIDSNTNFKGCDSIVHLNLSTKPKPIEPLPEDTFFCAGESILLNARNNGATYQWSSGSTQQQCNIYMTGSYWVSISLDQCSITDSIEVIQIDKPQVFLGDDTSICLIDSPLVLDAGSYEAYLWDPTNEQTAQITVIREGTYSVQVWDLYGCRAVDSIHVINDCKSLVYAPTAFSPNNDLLNDRFEVLLTGAEFTGLKIFNRWGMEVYSTNQATQGWDGTYKGKLCPAGVYVYILKYNTSKGPKIAYGSITLVR